MNKQLYILRHAAAETVAESDKTRPLSAAGRAAARALGQTLRDTGIAPSHVLCSPARRTRETWTLLAMTQTAALFPDALYNAPAGTLYEQMKTVPQNCAAALIVAHNPGVGQLVRFLTGQDMCFAPGVLAEIAIKADRWDIVMPAENDLRRVF